MIIGCNGMIWVAKYAALQPSNDNACQGAVILAQQDHENICRVANVIRGLALLRLTISSVSIQMGCHVCTPFCGLCAACSTV